MPLVGQAAQERETPFSVRRRQHGGRNVLEVNSSAGEMDTLRARISSQSRAVAAHIAADAEAQAFFDDWATPEPLARSRPAGGKVGPLIPHSHRLTDQRDRAATAQAAGCPRHWGLELMARRSFSDGSRGDERLIRQLLALLRQHRPDLMQGEKLYRSPAGFTSWSGHWAKAVAVELALEQSESIADHVGIWGAMVCQWAREIGAEPRFLSPALAQAFLQTEQPTLPLDLPRDISCFRLLLPKGTLFSEEGPEIRSVVVAEVRAMEGWLPDNFELARGGMACIGLGEDGSTYLASNVLDPAAKAQQPAHTDFSPTLWDWDALASKAELHPTKKAAIRGNRRLIAPTSLEDSATALLVSLMPALSPLRALIARRAGPAFLWGSRAALANSVTSVSASARVSSGSCMSASTLALSSWSSSRRLGWPAAGR